MLGVSCACPSQTNNCFVYHASVCVAGLHISLGIGLRLFNFLLHDCQKLDLELALLSEKHGHEASQAAIKLLQELQLLEKQIEDQQDAAEQHQAVYDYLTMTGDVDLTERNQQHQLQQLAELITTLQKDPAEKV